VPIITDFLKAIGLKNIILGIFLIAALTNYAYQNRQIKSLKSNLKKTNATLEKKEQKIK
jgi:cell division protein FtsB